MKEIQLPHGMVALVDNEDFDKINAFAWNFIKKGNVFYAWRFERKDEYGSRRRRRVQMHHMIVGHPGKLVVDHINHNGLDNRKCNLRIVPKRENHMNPIRKNKTGFVGVYKNYHKYVTNIRINGRKKCIGSFNTPEEAHAAYITKYNEIRNREV